MDAFLSKHKRRIAGTPSCVDRIVFKGYLPIPMSQCVANLYRYVEICLARNARNG